MQKEYFISHIGLEGEYDDAPELHLYSYDGNADNAVVLVAVVCLTFEDAHMMSASVVLEEHDFSPIHVLEIVMGSLHTYRATHPEKVFDCIEAYFDDSERGLVVNPALVATK